MRAESFIHLRASRQ